MLVLLFFIAQMLASQGTSYQLMGTYAYIELPNENLNYSAYKYLKEIEGRLSHYIDSSDVSKINLNAGKKFVKVSDFAIEISEKTRGVFDVSIGALTINAKRLGKLSEDSARKLVNFKDIVVSGDSIKLLKEGMAIDLGG